MGWEYSSEAQWLPSMHGALFSFTDTAKEQTIPSLITEMSISILF